MQKNAHICVVLYDKLGFRGEFEKRCEKICGAPLRLPAKPGTELSGVESLDDF